MHIKFLDHGKGSAAHASAYVLDELDHLGHVRAGVEVLRGDAHTFNAACDASPHLWKYTSGVIAWSVEDNPSDAQIQELLDEFEQHAFSGLDPAQYHLFAVLHTDNDGSKHLHVLIPRLDLDSGKSLKTLITERLAPTPVQDRQRPEPEPDNKPKPSRDFDFDF